VIVHLPCACEKSTRSLVFEKLDPVTNMEEEKSPHNSEKKLQNRPKKGKLRCAAVKITLKKISVENIDVEFSPGTSYEELENFKQLSPPVQLRNISWSQNSPEKILPHFPVPPVTKRIIWMRKNFFFFVLNLLLEVLIFRDFTLNQNRK